MWKDFPNGKKLFIHRAPYFKLSEKYFSLGYLVNIPLLHIIVSLFHITTIQYYTMI